MSHRFFLYAPPARFFAGKLRVPRGASGGAWLARYTAVCAAITVSLGIATGCTTYDMQPGVPSHDPDYNPAARGGENMATSSRMDGTPMCKGGSRAQHCILGERCTMTGAGCQVCVCETWE
jgi:hypothetical protein